MGNEALDQHDLECDWFDFLVKHGHIHAGTPQYVTERLKRFQTELGCEHIVLHWAVPRVTFEEYRNSLTLFADKVMPNF